MASYGYKWSPVRVLGCGLILWVAGGAAGASAQNLSSAPEPAVGYIHRAWDRLTRSVTDCRSLVDLKVNESPVLYVPVESLRLLSGTVALSGNSPKSVCQENILPLPRRIHDLGDVSPEELAASGRRPGLLYLPNPYVVPGGRFNEMYGWDSYFIILGLISDHRETLAKGMVENFFFEIEHYGAVLNANRTYYLTRSQPPFLTSMIEAVYDDPQSFKNAAEKRAWLEHAYAMAARDYGTWLRPEHEAGDTGLARYWDFDEGPVPEMADDSTYYADVIRWMASHPEQGSRFLLKGSATPGEDEAARLRETSCDVMQSVGCMQAQADGYRLTRDFYKGDRAMRESGFDTSFRFEAFSGATQDYAPVCLNSLLFRYETDMGRFAHLLGNGTEAGMWELRAKARKAAMEKYLWRPQQGTFADYDFVSGKSSTYSYVTSLYPLWAGVATRDEAVRVEKTLKLFERPGGLAESATNSGMQWDEPYGWAPTTWLAVAGLDAYQFHDDARRIAREFMTTVDRGFAADGTIREKYNVEAANADVKVTAGYTTNVIGFGWTNGVYLKLLELAGSK